MKIAVIGSSLESLHCLNFFKNKNIHLCFWSELDPVQITKFFNVENEYHDLLKGLQGQIIWRNNSIKSLQKSRIDLDINSKRMDQMFRIIYEAGDLESYEDFDFVIESSHIEKAHSYLGGSQPCVNEEVHRFELPIVNEKVNNLILFGDSNYLRYVLSEGHIPQSLMLVTKGTFDESIHQSVEAINEAAYKECRDEKSFKYPVSTFEEVDTLSFDKLEDQKEYFATLETKDGEIKTLMCDSAKPIYSRIWCRPYHFLLKVEEPGYYWLDYYLFYNDQQMKLRFNEIFKDINLYFSPC